MGFNTPAPLSILDRTEGSNLKPISNRWSNSRLYILSFGGLSNRCGTKLLILPARVARMHVNVTTTTMETEMTRAKTWPHARVTQDLL